MDSRRGGGLDRAKSGLARIGGEERLLLLDEIHIGIEGERQMAQKNFMRKCAGCSSQTMHVQQKPNHILHLILTICTAGLWLLVWILVSLFQDKPQCTVCGKSPGLFGIG